MLIAVFSPTRRSTREHGRAGEGTSESILVDSVMVDATQWLYERIAEDKESTGAYPRMVLSRSGKSRITDTVRVAYLVRLSPRPCFQDSLDYPKFPHK